MSFYILLFKTCSHHCHKIMPSQVFYCSSINFFLQIYRGDIFNHSNVEFGQPKKKKVEFGQLLVEIIKILTISRRNYLKFSNFRVSAINNGLKIPTFWHQLKGCCWVRFRVNAMLYLTLLTFHVNIWNEISNLW